MNKEKYDAAEFAHRFRCDLYKEHFGIPYDEIKDPISDEFWDRIQSIARVK